MSPSNWNRILALRYRLASVPAASSSSDSGSLINSPLAWLNDALEVASRRSARDQDQTLGMLVKAFSSQRAKGKPACRQWILELMGQIRVLARSRGPSEAQLAFLFEAFSVSLALFSEVDSALTPRDKVLLERSLRLLPVSVRGARDLGPQLAEWMVSFCAPGKGRKVAPPGFEPAHARPSWQQCLEAMRGCLVAYKECDKYEEPTMWSRLVTIEMR